MDASRQRNGAFDAMLEWLLHAAEPISRAGGILLGVLIIAVVALVDVILGSAVQLTAMYVLGPIATAWCSRRRDALWVAALAALCSTALHLATGAIVPETGPIVATFAFRLVAVALMVGLTSKVRWSMQQLEDLSMRDDLTGLLNRRALVERLDEEIARARRNEQPIALIYADVDEFKTVNDRFGHAIGDEFLMRVAEGLELTLRPSDVVARMGGDEYVIVLPETDAAGAAVIATRIAEQLADLTAQYGAALSLGIAAFPEAPESVEAALHLADHEMYAVKRERKAQALAALG